MLALVPTDTCVSRLGNEEGKWLLPALFFFEKFPKDLYPSSTCSEISEQISLVYTPVIFQTAASVLCLCKLFVVLSLERHGLSFL